MRYRISENCPHCGHNQEWQVSDHTPRVSISKCQRCDQPYAADLNFPNGYGNGCESVNQRQLTTAEAAQWQADQRWVDAEIDRLSPGVRQRFERPQQRGLLQRLHLRA